MWSVDGDVMPRNASGTGANNVSANLDQSAYKLFWELLQEFRETNGYLERIADHFDPPKGNQQNDGVFAVTALEQKLDRILEQLRGDDPSPKKNWYTTKEAAEALPSYKETTLRQACNLGRIPDAKKINREWRIPRKAVELISNVGLPAPGK